MFEKGRYYIDVIYKRQERDEESQTERERETEGSLCVCPVKSGM